MKFNGLAVALFALAATPAVAQESDNDKSGFRIEARASYETPTVEGEEIFEDDEELYKLGSAFAFGAEAGFDVAVGSRVVIGPYANYEKSTVESCEGSDCVRAESSWSAGAELGYLVGSNGMFYAKLGYTELTLEADLDINGVPVSETDSGGGIGGAIGYEHGFGANLYGRIEGGYADVGDIFGIAWQRRHAGVALGVRF